MTEKRFVNIAKEPIFIVVNDTFEDEVLADDDVVDCLNELSDKNGQLEKENEQLKKENQHFRKVFGNKYDAYIDGKIGGNVNEL